MSALDAADGGARGASAPDDLTGGFTPFAPTVIEDPYPAYARLRTEDPVHYSAVLGAYVLSRHADVSAAFRDPAAFSSAPPGGGTAGNRFLLGSDPPEHTVLRKVVNRRFTPKTVAALEPDVRDVAERLTGELLAARSGGVADYVAHVAGALPAIVVARLLGVPEEERETFRTWGDAMVGGVGLDPAGAARAFVEMRAYFLDVAARRAADPGDDLISHLVTGSEPLSHDELWGFCTLLLIAGTETTTNLVGNAVSALLADPELLGAVRTDPATIPAVVEETLRHDAPVQAVWRLARSDVEVGGRTIPAGARVLLLQGSANRDPHLHADADRFDPRRPDQTHISFGLGIHFCLGAPLARMETRLALETLLAATTHLAAGGPARRVDPAAEAAETAQSLGRVRRSAATAGRVRRNPIVRGFRTLPLDLR